MDLPDSATGVTPPYTATVTSVAPPDQLQPKRRLIFAIVSMALLMSSVDQTIVATALPAIQRDLHAQISWTSWTITIYALGQVLVMPLAGRLSDHYGRKKVLVVAVILFTVASLSCGLANNIYELILLRAVQAIGGGAFMPSATGIVSDQFGKDRDRALGMFSSIFPIGGIIGPVLGGVFVAAWSWRGIFLINVPIGIVLLILAIKFIPHSEPKPAGRSDVCGVLLLGVLILSAMSGITYLGSGRTQLYSPLFVLCGAVTLITAWLFVAHTKHHSAPFIPARFLLGRDFGVMNLINFLYGAAVLGFATLIPLYAEDRYGLHSLAAGTLLSARAIGMISMAGLAVLALRRTGCRLPMIIGFVGTAIGMFLMAASPPSVSPYVWLALAAGVTGIGVGIAQPGANNATLHLAPDHIAAIAGLRGMFRQSGGIMAVAITTAILARDGNPGIAQAHVFVVFAVMLIAAIPFLFLVPDHRGSW
jgi:EmrB/QacA subfamily drug resistance transporter